jgi:hypothetical protein
MTMPENHSNPADPVWTVVQQATADDGLHLLRVLDVGVNFPFRNYPERFSVLWEFAELDAEGLPSAAELTRMKDFENALCAVMQADHTALLVMVFTEPAHREFIWLARNCTGGIFILPAGISHTAAPVSISAHSICRSSPGRVNR